MHEALVAMQPIAVRLINYRRDGTPFVNDLTIVPIRDSVNSPPTHFLGTLREQSLAVPPPIWPQHSSSSASEPFVPTQLQEALQREMPHPQLITERVPPFKVIHVNPAWCQLSGYPAEHLIGRPYTVLHGPQTERDLPLRLEEAFRNGSRYSCKATLSTASQQPFQARLIVSPLLGTNGGGEAQYFVHVLADYSGSPIARRAEELGHPLPGSCSQTMIDSGCTGSLASQALLNGLTNCQGWNGSVTSAPASKPGFVSSQVGGMCNGIGSGIGTGIGIGVSNGIGNGNSIGSEVADMLSGRLKNGLANGQLHGRLKEMLGGVGLSGLHNLMLGSNVNGQMGGIGGPNSLKPNGFPHGGNGSIAGFPPGSVGGAECFPNHFDPRAALVSSNACGGAVGNGGANGGGAGMPRGSAGTLHDGAVQLTSPPNHTERSGDIMFLAQRRAGSDGPPSTPLSFGLHSLGPNSTLMQQQQMRGGLYLQPGSQPQGASQVGHQASHPQLPAAPMPSTQLSSLGGTHASTTHALLGRQQPHGSSERSFASGSSGMPQRNDNGSRSSDDGGGGSNDGSGGSNDSTEPASYSTDMHGGDGLESSHAPSAAAHDRANGESSRSSGRVPPFLTKLYTIVDEAMYDMFVTWCSGGTAFRIADPQAFAETLLPRFFKHNKLGSFQQQLLTYGFTRVPNSSCLDISATWQHQHFLQDRPELLEQMTRVMHRSLKNGSDRKSSRDRAEDSSDSEDEEIIRMHDDIHKLCASLHELHDELRTARVTEMRAIDALMDRVHKRLKPSPMAEKAENGRRVGNLSSNSPTDSDPTNSEIAGSDSQAGSNSIEQGAARLERSTTSSEATNGSGSDSSNSTIPIPFDASTDQDLSDGLAHGLDKGSDRRHNGGHNGGRRRAEADDDIEEGGRAVSLASGKSGVKCGADSDETRSDEQSEASADPPRERSDDGDDGGDEQPQEDSGEDDSPDDDSEAQRSQTGERNADDATGDDTRR